MPTCGPDVEPPTIVCAFAKWSPQNTIKASASSAATAEFVPCLRALGPSLCRTCGSCVAPMLLVVASKCFMFPASSVFFSLFKAAITQLLAASHALNASQLQP